MSEDPTDVPEGIEVYPPVAVVSPISLSNNSTKPDSLNCHRVDDETHTISLNRISHVESGEKAWWMDSNTNISDDINKVNKHDIESNSNSDSSESYEKYDIHNISSTQSIMLSKFPIEFPPPPPISSGTLNEPLGDRASPEGVSVFQFTFFFFSSPFSFNSTQINKFIFLKLILKKKKIHIKYHFFFSLSILSNKFTFQIFIIILQLIFL